jgi:hypothetical protein
MARLDIDDDRVVCVDQVVGGIGEEGVALVGTGPRGRVGRRDELRCDRARCAERRIIERSQILLHSPSGVCIGMPLFPRRRALLVGVGSDQAGVDRKALAADQPLVQATLQHCLEQVCVSACKFCKPIRGQSSTPFDIGHAPINPGPPDWGWPRGS